jgi:hypothetical protein
MEIESIIKKMKEICNFEYSLLPGANDNYYNLQWTEIKELIANTEKQQITIAECAKKIDKNIENILEYISGKSEENIFN